MSDENTAVITEPRQGVDRAHQPGQAVFKSVLPENIDWKPFAAFPPSVRLAVVVGHPSEAGRPLYDPGQSAPRRQADAAPTPGGSCLYSGLRRFLHRSRRRVRPR
jgi:hypothetical protein